MRLSIASALTLSSLAAASIQAATPEPALPSGFVCSIAGAYKLSRTGIIESAGAKPASGTVTIDTRSGVVAGDAINASLWSWRLIQPIDARTGAKLLGTSNNDVAELSVMTDQPTTRESTTWYPFVFLSAGRGSLVSGLCRGAHD
ncbi:MAG: hypothetical protein JOZ12_03990 [Sinobacteraceae bacterium]|nr:hypothetical protein [Nevskiaceae bacterium]